MLASIEKEEMYGYGLKVRMSQLMKINENTLYPLLRRLEKEEYLTIVNKTSESNRIRKYYSITPKGKQHLKNKKIEWINFIESVNKILFREDEFNE